MGKQVVFSKEETLALHYKLCDLVVKCFVDKTFTENGNKVVRIDNSQIKLEALEQDAINRGDANKILVPLDITTDYLVQFAGEDVIYLVGYQADDKVQVSIFYYVGLETKVAELDGIKKRFLQAYVDAYRTLSTL